MTGGTGASAKRHRLGVLSDTHGLLRPQALAALQGTELIIHAGDIGDAGILEALRSVAPVVAVRGNIDRAGWAEALPVWEVVEIGGALLYVIHDINTLDLDPAAAGFAAVIYGHSHRPAIRTERGVVLLNPGSAGPRRFTLPVSVAVIEVTEKGIEPRLIELDPGHQPREP